MNFNKIIDLCEEFYSEFNRLPKHFETYKDWNIGFFISGLKKGSNKDLKPTIESIFNCKIEVSKPINKKSHEECIQLCKEFYSEFNRLPTSKETYKGWKIGSFISCLKHGYNKDLKPAIESIFNCKIEVNNSIVKKSHEEYIQLCKEFYSEFNRLPVKNEIFKGWNIGTFISGLKRGYNKDLKPTIESIFNCKIEVSKPIIKKSSEEYIQLCNEFYNEFNRLPKRNETYKDWMIGNFISGLKHGYNKDLKPDIEFIFNCKIEDSPKDEKYIQLCEEFYNEFNRLPKRNEIYKDWKIGMFITGLKHGKNKDLKPAIESIFNCNI